MPSDESLGYFRTSRPGLASNAERFQPFCFLSVRCAFRLNTAESPNFLPLRRKQSRHLLGTVDANVLVPLVLLVLLGGYLILRNWG